MPWYAHLIIWPVAGIVALAALSFLVVLLVARFERKHLGRITALMDEEGPSARSKWASAIAEEAVSLGFLHMGAFHDGESSIIKVRIDLFLSEDGRVLLLIPPLVRTLGYRLISRMADDVWLFSMQNGGDIDQSGLRIAVALSGCSMPQVLHYHRDRIEAYPCEPRAFDPETLARDLFEHDVQRARRTIELGRGRWVSIHEDCWTCNWRGAFRQAYDTFFCLGKISRENALSELYKEAD